MSWTSPFEEKSVDKLLRYESSLSRRLLKEIERLERLQEQRMETLDDVECDDKADAGATELGAAEVIGGEPCDNDFVTNNCFIDGSKHEKLIEDILADGDSEPFE